MIRPRSAQTPADVAAHYDTLDPFYRDLWGEHVHHGYWRTGQETPADAAAALIGLVSDRLDLRAGQKVCDIGCGYGATAQMLAETHNVSVTGITLSEVQHARAERRVPLRGALAFKIGDWLSNGFPTAGFDHAYAIESTEHMADKMGCFTEAFRTLRPGGRLIVCAWVAGKDPRPWQINYLLKPICQEGRLPGLGDATEYVDTLCRAGFAVPTVTDITSAVGPTWTVCIGRALQRFATNSRYWRFMLSDKSRDRIFALTLLRMLMAFRTGAMRYVVLTATKFTDKR